MADHDADVPVPVLDFNYYSDPALNADPWKRYDDLRGEHRWFRVDDGPAPIWFLTQYDDIHEGFQRYDLFSNEAVEAYSPVGLHRYIPAELDPPEHTRYRQLVMPWFTPAKAQELEPKVRAWCNELIDGFVADGEVDFLNQFSRKFPTYIFMEMMGCPLSDADTLLGLAGDFLRTGGLDHKEAHHQAMESIKGYLGDLLDARRAAPADDLVTFLTTLELDGRLLTQDELLQISLVLFLGGLDTVASQLACMFHHFATHPDDRQQVVDDAAIVPTAVEELLRYYSILSSGRVVTEDVDFHGCPMKKGDRLLLTTVPANRDERQFPEADKVKLDRSPNRHIAFAVGPHRCLGIHLARIELNVAIEEWHRRIPHYRVAEGTAPALHAGNVIGFDSLRLSWD